MKNKEKEKNHGWGDGEGCLVFILFFCIPLLVALIAYLIKH